jgi:uncharacterized protein (TIGR02300 family)
MNTQLGTKRICPECGAKFYDFNKSELCCPKCDHAWVIAAEAAVKPVAVKAPPKPKPVVVADDDDDEGFADLGAVAELENLDDDDYEDYEHLEEVEDHHEEPEIRMDSDDAEDEMFIDELEENGFHIIDELNDDGEMKAGY